MNTEQIARRFDELAQQNNFETIIKELFSAEAKEHRTCRKSV